MDISDQPSAAESDAKRGRYHHGDLRAKLIEATRDLVETKGADHFSVSEACRAAGVSTAAPYKHFKDKDEMLRAVVIEGMARQHAEMQAELAPLPEGSLDRITALGRLYLRFATEEPGVFRLKFGVSNSHGNHPDLVARGANVFGLVKGEVAAFYGRSEPSGEDEQRAFMLWSFVHGLSFLLIDGKLAKMGAQFDIEDMLVDIARRVMLDPNPSGLPNAAI